MAEITAESSPQLSPSSEKPANNSQNYSAENPQPWSLTWLGEKLHLLKRKTAEPAQSQVQSTPIVESVPTQEAPLPTTQQLPK